MKYIKCLDYDLMVSIMASLGTVSVHKIVQDLLKMHNNNGNNDLH